LLCCCGCFENEFHFDGHAQWETRHAKDEATREALRPKNVVQQVRGAVGDTRLIEEISAGRHIDSKANDAPDSVERSEVLTRSREAAQCSGTRRVSPGFHIEFFAKPPQVLWNMPHDRQHPAEKEQIASFQNLHVTTKGRGGRRQNDAQLCNPGFGARW